MGLDHTHRGGCLDEDGVADTPAKMNGANQPWYQALQSMCIAWKQGGARPGVAQLANFDSCPAKPGVDNVFNYLSYNPAACRVLFTPGQVGSSRGLPHAHITCVEALPKTTLFAWHSLHSTERNLLILCINRLLLKLSHDFGLLLHAAGDYLLVLLVAYGAFKHNLVADSLLAYLCLPLHLAVNSG